MSLAVVARSRRNRSVDKPNEDAYAVRLDGLRTAIVVADGVTRSRRPDGGYPDPSGAALTARLVAHTLVSALATPETQVDLAAAFRIANQAVDQLNRAHHVWDRLDYGEHDLWGAVATVAVVERGRVRWGHIGDAVLLHLPSSSGLHACTPDQVAAANRLLATLPADEVAAPGGRDGYARSRLRNRPEETVSYGVLTGEPAAEQYVVTGELAVARGDRLALCTDGLRSLGADAGWSALEPWLRGPFEVSLLERLLLAAEDADHRRHTRSDDKTVVLAAV